MLAIRMYNVRTAQYTVGDPLALKEALSPPFNLIPILGDPGVVNRGEGKAKLQGKQFGEEKLE